VTDTRLALDVTAHEPMELAVNSPFMPGWTVRLNGVTVEPAIESGSGYMIVPVPAGRHRVEAFFGRTVVRLVSEAVTAATALAWISLISVAAIRRGRRALPRPSAPDRSAPTRSRP
jgi:hypothetical protein